MPGQQTRGRRYEYDDGSPAPRSHDRERRRAARDRDAPLERAYKAGRAGDDREATLVELASGSDYSVADLEPYFDQGAGDAASEARGDRQQQRRQQLEGQAREVGARAGNLANDGAGFLLGLFAYALMANWLRFGKPGVTGWLSAKFVNKPATGLAGRRPRPPATPAAGAGAGASSAGVGAGVIAGQRGSR